MVRNCMLILLFLVLISQLVCVFSLYNYRKRHLFPIATQQHCFLTNYKMEGSVIFHFLCLLLWFWIPGVTQGQNGKCTCVVTLLLNSLQKIPSNSGWGLEPEPNDYKTLLIKSIVIIASQYNSITIHIKILDLI